MERSSNTKSLSQQDRHVESTGIGRNSQRLD